MKLFLIAFIAIASTSASASEIRGARKLSEKNFSDEIGTNYIESEIAIDLPTGRAVVKKNLLKLSGGNLVYRLDDQDSKTIILHRKICESRGYDLPSKDSYISFTEDTIFAFPCQRTRSSQESRRNSASAHGKLGTKSSWACNTQAYVAPPGLVLVGETEIFEAGAWFETGTGMVSSQGNLFGMVGSTCGFSRNAYVPGNGGGMDVFVIRACRFNSKGMQSMNATSEICGSYSNDYQSFIVQ